MGIYIKGMEMPKDCWGCHFGHGDTGVCVVDFKSHGDWNEPQNCPLVPIPPHGDLIDRDAIKEDLLYDVEMDSRALDSMDLVGSERKNIQDDKDIKQNCVTILDDAPTIIPAEEGE